MQVQEKDRRGEQELFELLEKYEPIRENLIPILQEVQGNHGYISEDSVGRIAEYLDISQSCIYGVATFYTQFRFARPGDHIVKVCLGTACHVKGGAQIMDDVSRRLHISPGETSSDYRFSLERVACFGSCALSPVIVVDGKVYGRMNPKRLKKILKELE